MFLTSFTSLCFTSFSSVNHLLSLCTVFDSISSNIDEVFSINPSANVFVFGHFDIHHEDCLTYSSGADRPGELVIFVILSNDLTQMVNFSIWIPDSDFQCPALFWIYFFLLMLVFVLQCLSLYLVILSMLLSQFLFTFHQTQSGMSHFIA